MTPFRQQTIRERCRARSPAASAESQAEGAASPPTACPELATSGCARCELPLCAAHLPPEDHWCEKCELGLAEYRRELQATSARAQTRQLFVASAALFSGLLWAILWEERGWPDSYFGVTLLLIAVGGAIMIGLHPALTAARWKRRERRLRAEYLARAALPAAGSGAPTAPRSAGGPPDERDA